MMVSVTDNNYFMRSNSNLIVFNSCDCCFLKMNLKLIFVLSCVLMVKAKFRPESFIDDFSEDGKDKIWKKIHFQDIFPRRVDKFYYDDDFWD